MIRKWPAAVVLAAATAVAFAAVLPTAADIQLRRRPEDVARTALVGLGPGASVVRVTAVASDAEVAKYEPGSARPAPGQTPSGPVWIVRARGNCVGERTPPGVPPVRSKTCYFVVDDRTGQTIEFGIP